MEQDQQHAELLKFFKALADANRLKIVGLLAQGDYSVQELAEMLSLRASTVSHHLARLSQAGLVSARAESYYNVYCLETDALEGMARRLLSRETLPAAAADVDLDAYDRKVIKNFTDVEGRIKALPAQRKKLEAILRYILRAFEPDRVYTEKEVNEIIGGYYEDTATLRRELIMNRLMDRKTGGSEYWLTGRELRS